MCIVAIKPWEKGLVVRKGKVEKILDPGLHIVVFGRVVRVDRRSMAIELISQKLTTSDGRDLDVRYFVRYRIRDPVRSAMRKSDIPVEMERYVVDDPVRNIEMIPTVIGYTSHYLLKAVIGSMERSKAMNKGLVGEHLKEMLRKAFDENGIEIEDISIDDVFPTNRGVVEGVAAITYQVFHEDGSTKILPIEKVDVHPAGLVR